MIASESLRMVFLAIPRTGSFSITQTMTEHCQDLVKFGHHRMDVPRQYLFQGFYVWAVARNPYARMLSHYRHRARCHPRKVGPMTFRQFVERTSAETWSELNMMNDPPAVRWPLPKIAPVVNWFRYECLEEEWKRLPFWRGEAPPLHHINQSISNWGFYDQELADKVFRYYGPDFDRFGYDRESWRILK